MPAVVEPVGSGSAKVATSDQALPEPTVRSNGFLKLAPPAGSSEATSAAVFAYAPSFCTP
jgi:hypothetical protein